MKTHPAVVVLGAGRGTRFHRSHPKLAALLGGESVLTHTLRHALASRLPVVAVVSERLVDEAARWLARSAVVVMSERLPPALGGQGLGESIAAGVAARAGAPGWVLLPADMPLVQPATIRAVAGALPHHAVAYAQHLGLRGRPVGFSAEMFSELLRLEGDEGLRRLEARYPAHAVELDDPGVLHDMDTPADLARLQALLDAQGFPIPG
jgi:molybdenum cofactor cytidylyltransferase